MQVCVDSAAVLLCVQRGETALHMAARAGQVEVVRCLLRNGAIVDARARVRLRPQQFALSPPVMLPFFFFFLRVLLPLSSGGPDAPSHCVPSGKNRNCAASAAAHGPPRRCHDQRLHPPPHLRQGGAGGDGVCPAGGRGVALSGHQGGLRSNSLSLNLTTCTLLTPRRMSGIRGEFIRLIFTGVVQFIVGNQNKKYVFEPIYTFQELLAGVCEQRLKTLAVEKSD